MINSQLLNSLSDFFGAFRELVTLANSGKMDDVIAGLAEARADLAQHAAVKDDLAALEEFNATKQAQLDAIADSQAAVDEAAKLNTDHAKALQDADKSLEDAKAALAEQVKDLADKEQALKDREAAVELAEQGAKDTQAAADHALADAATLKQAYITKLQTLAQTEGASDVPSSS